MTGRARSGRIGALVAVVTTVLLAGGCTWVSVASHTPDGSDGNRASGHAVLDSAGNYLTFQSDASNLVDGDTNGVTDVFKADNVGGHVERPSVASDGTEGNGPSRNPDIDCCGGLIVFESDASNLVPGDTNGTTDVFVHNQTTKVTTLVSVAANGGPANGPSTHPVISADGKWIAFESTATNIVSGVSGHQVYVRPWQAGGPTQLVSRASCVSGVQTAGNGDSTRPHIDTFGQTVAFTSTATNFAVDPGNASPNAYAALTNGCDASTVPSLVGYDTAGHIPQHGSIATSIDGNGRHVAFDAYSASCPGSCTVAGVYVRDRTGSTSVAIAPGDPLAAGGSLEVGGNMIAIQATGPGSVSPVAEVITMSTGAARVISSDPAGHARAIQPVTDPASDGPTIAYFGGYFVYAAPGAGNVAQAFAQTTQPVPVVSAVKPSSIARGASNLVLTINGSFFAAGSVVTPPTGVTVDTTTFVDPNTLQVTVHVAPGAPTGPGGVTVAVPGGLGLDYGSLGSCSGCLTVN